MKDSKVTAVKVPSNVKRARQNVKGWIMNEGYKEAEWKILIASSRVNFLSDFVVAGDMAIIHAADKIADLEQQLEAFKNVEGNPYRVAVTALKTNAGLRQQLLDLQAICRRDN